MHIPLPACFRDPAAVTSPPSTASGPTLTASSYVTPLGLVSLTWSRARLGLSLNVELHLINTDNGAVTESEEPLNFPVRLWLLWNRRGSKRFRFRDGRHRRREVHVAWDLSRARFNGGAEPWTGFSVKVSVDGREILLAGDTCDVAFTRREHVVCEGNGKRGNAWSYETRAMFEGRERVISIELGRAKEMGMSVAVDGCHVLRVRRLRWKFRGSEEVEVDGGIRILVSWDVHNWLFNKNRDDAGVFVFRFQKEGHFGKSGGEFSEGVVHRDMDKGYFGKSWSESSSGGAERRREKKHMKTRSLSSSSSSLSSASSSTVMEWVSQEETHMQNNGGFTLLVYACKRY